MALGTKLGDGYISVGAVTTGLDTSLSDSFKGLERIAQTAGRRATRSFNKELSQMAENHPLGQFRASLKSIAPEAERTFKTFHRLIRVGYVLQAGMAQLAGTVGAVVGGIGALGGVALGAAPSIVALGGAFGSLIVGMQVAKGAFKGIGQALSGLKAGGGGGGTDNSKQIEDAMRSLALVVESSQRRIVDANNKIRNAQLNLNQAFKQGREEIQQLGFSAEEAALGEKRAALQLEQARENLARAQDLPPNSRVRREAELAYQEAELNYRQAKDSASDLGKEQDRLARRGIEGTQVVIDARQELAEAELNLRDTVIDSLRDQEEAQRRLNDAQTAGAAGGGNDPLKGLTQSQKVFVGYLYNDVLPALFTLKEAAADSFLPVLQQQMQRMFGSGLFETLRSGIEAVSAGLAGAVTNFTDVITQSDFIERFASFFNTSAQLLPKFGTAFGNAFSIVLTLLQAAAPITERFANWIVDVTDRFNNFLDVGQKTGQLTDFFKTSADLAARFGGVFRDIFGGIGDIIAANVGPGSGGDILLTWLEKAASGFNNMGETFLENYFKGAAANFTEILDTFGILVDVVIEAGANPAVGEFFQALQAGAGVFRQLVISSVEASAVFGDLINVLFQIFAIFQDAEPLEYFLETLRFMASGALSFLKAIEPVLKILGPLLGIASALGFSFIVLGKALSFGAGFLLKVTGGFQVLQGFLLKNTIETKALTVSNRELALAKAQLNLLNKQEIADAAARSLARATELGQTNAITAANARMTIANQGLAAAKIQVGIAGTTAMNMLKVAMGPVGLIILALTAAAAGIFAVVALDQMAMDKAVKATTESMKNGEPITKQWGNAMLASRDGFGKDFVSDLSNLSTGLDILSDKQGYVARETAKAREEVDALGLSQLESNTRVGILTDQIKRQADGIEGALEKGIIAYGTSLQNLYVDNLPAAQRSFKELSKSMGDQTKQLEFLETFSDDATKAIEEQAAAMGVDILAADGTVDAIKRLEFAQGKGAVAVLEYNKMLAANAEAMNTAALATTNAMDLGKVGADEGEITFDQFLLNLQDKATKATANIKAASDLALLGMNASTLEALQASGLSAVEIQAEVGARGGAAFIAEQNAAVLEASGMLQQAREAAGKLTSSTLNDIALASLESGNLTIEEFLNITGAEIAGYEAPLLDIQPGTEAFKNLPADVQKALNDAADPSLAIEPEVLDTVISTTLSTPFGEILLPIEVKTSSKTTSPTAGNASGATVDLSRYGYYAKNGGYIKPLRFASGGYAAGFNGFLSGAGGPRDDRIPAMLSAGEYVVNAMSTKRFMPLLNAINNGSPVAPNNMSVAGGSSSNINITVNPSPGMDEKSLAFAVSRELAFQMRKGAV